MPTSTVLVYEFFTAGGFQGKRFHSDLAAEALGLLWASLVDFKLWGSVRTVTALDSRSEDIIPGLNRTTLPADKVVSVRPDHAQDVFCSLLENCDAALLIAPETDGILASLTAKAEDSGIPVLGSSSSAAALAGNKARCHEIFKNAGLPVPATWCIAIDSVLQKARGMSLPLILKPIDGVGSEGVHRVEHDAGFAPALESIRGLTSHKQILLQAFASGHHASVSILAGRNRCLPLSLNLQMIDIGSPCRYLGSHVPFQHQAASLALELARSAVSAIPGLRGYVGVDIVLAENSAQLVEINPRLTTSYIALRQVTTINLARAIWESCILDILPDHVPISGQAIIKKDDSNSWGLSDW